MLNVSCQKQRHCSPLPADSPAESPMEFVEQPRSPGACYLLVPGLSSLDVDDEEGEVEIGIRPRSSPLPRRRSSFDEDSESDLPLWGSRRVSFADAKGLDLVQVKEFDTWDVPKLPGYSSDGKDAEEYFISPLTFSPSLSTEELLVKVQEQKIELEAIELLPGTTILKGMIRVLNVSFDKTVYVRTSLDSWSNHFDLLAEYIPGSSKDLMDCFSFRLTLVPPFDEQGARVDFCLRYETPVGTFWANNNNKNYVLLCHRGMTEQKEKPLKEHKKSCLKTVSQNFLSALESSSQEDMQTDESNHGEIQICDGQSRSSEENGNTLETESKRNSTRRSRRKAARMARVKDFFSQRNGALSDEIESDTSPLDAKQATKEEIPAEKISDMQSFSERNNEPEGSSFVSETPATCSNNTLDKSLLQGNTSNNNSEEPENIVLADSASLTRCETATDISDNPSHSDIESSAAEGQDTKMSFSTDEERSQNEGTSYEYNTSVGTETSISAPSSEPVVGHPNSFVFGTVVAPLYHQVFGRVGGETESLSAWGNPDCATHPVADPHNERRESSYAVSTDAECNHQQVLGNVIQESEQECLDATFNVGEEKSLMADGRWNDAEMLQDPGDDKKSDHTFINIPQATLPPSGDEVINHQAVNIINTDGLNAQIPAESINLLERAQEDNLTSELQNQTGGEINQAQPPKQICPESETQHIMACRQNSSPSPPQMKSQLVACDVDAQTSSCDPNVGVDESNTEDAVGQTVIKSTTNESSEEDELLHGRKHIDHPAAKETENSCVSCFDIVEETIVGEPETSVETHEETENMERGDEEAMNVHEDETNHSAEIEVSDKVAESTTKTATCNHHVHGDMFLERRDEVHVVFDKGEQLEMKVPPPRKKRLSLLETTEVKNWEMMVKEEEKCILTDEALSAEDVETVEDELGVHKASGIEEDMIEEGSVAVTAADQKDVEDEDENRSTEREGGSAEKEGVDEEYVQATKMGKKAREEEIKEEIDVWNGEEEEELGKETHFVENQRGSVAYQEDWETLGGTEIDKENDTDATKVKTEEQDIDEEAPEEEVQVDEAGEARIVDEESEVTSIEDITQERLDITQNKVEDGSSALWNNVQEGVVEMAIDNENTGEGQPARVPAELLLNKEEDFQTNRKNVSHDPSKAVTDESHLTAVQGGLCSSTEEPEYGRTSHDSASDDSESDDEVELYMHCLRAVHTGAQAMKDQTKDTGSRGSRRSSVGRGRRLSTPMPPISESQDEEQQQLSCLLDNHEDTDTADIQSTAAAPSVSSGEENISRNVSWWRETFSCSNISKTLLYATLLVLFLLVAYHYDFLACFGLYLISVVWLLSQGERQQAKNKRIG